MDLLEYIKKMSGESGENKVRWYPDPSEFVYNKAEIIKACRLYSRKFSEKLDQAKKYNPKIFTWFITINPHTDNISILRGIFPKILAKSYIKSCFYTFEQRSEKSNKFYGYHVHGLFEFNKYKKKFDIIREFHNTSKLICKKTSIDAKFLKTQEDIDRVKNYIQGNKQECKAAKVRNDMLWRKAEGLSSNYFYPVSK